MIKVILAILFLSIASFPAETAGADAPFGFKWGQKINMAKCTNVKEVAPGFVVCETATVSKPVQKMDFVLLAIYKGALVKITAFMKNVEGDPYGVKGTESYENMKSLLSKKYGEPVTATEFIGRELYQEPSEFYQCLKYDGCGMFFSVWGDSDESQVALELVGLGRGTGCLKIIYESNAFRKALAEIEQNEEMEAGENL